MVFTVRQSSDYFVIREFLTISLLGFPFTSERQFTFIGCLKGLVSKTLICLDRSQVRDGVT